MPIEWTRCSDHQPDKPDRYLIHWEYSTSYHVGHYEYSVPDRSFMWFVGDNPLPGKYAPTHWAKLEAPNG